MPHHPHYVSQHGHDGQPVFHGGEDYADYRWSSYAHHAGIAADPLVADHPLYWALGNTPFEREAVYWRLTERGMSSNEIARLERRAGGMGARLGRMPDRSWMKSTFENSMAPSKKPALGGLCYYWTAELL